MSSKTDSFLRLCLNAAYHYPDYDELKISTATIDVRLDPSSNIAFNEVWHYLMERKVQGFTPVVSKRNFKNSKDFKVRLPTKWVNVKMSVNSLHITGCKTLEQAAHATRCIQILLQMLDQKGLSVYDEYPLAVRFDVCMINYNYNVGVGIHLPEFDVFVDRMYPSIVYSSYDQNVHASSLDLRVPLFKTVFTIHDNGQICMCISEHDIDRAVVDSERVFNALYDILRAYRETTC